VTASLAPRGKAETPAPLDRISRRVLTGAIDDRLLFAQVREDPLLEIDALNVRHGGRFVVVGSGGCTALSIIAAGAGNVAAVDLNKTQNHLTELKAVSLGVVSPWEYQGFLGAEPMQGKRRARIYWALREHLSVEAVRYWDAHGDLIEGGVLRAGASEQFLRILASVVRAAVQPRSRIERLLACRSLEEQRRLYHDEWNNRRWRALFPLLVNRWTFNKTFDPAFFANVENPSFARHFHRLFEQVICEGPASTNYFLHFMLTGGYPVLRDGGVPPYLDPAWDPSLDDIARALEIVDGRYEDYLRSCRTSSVDGFALSNICEWMDDFAIEALFEEVVRVAKPGARLVFRNFVGHTEVPERLRDRVREDREAGLKAIAKDRSCVQARIAICRIEKQR
jgi:S-adenosylmethionine-diacylglycerol 3-amino-3-carboxypropyl transferase